MILLSLSLSVSKQHNPFLSTYESIVVKGSGRVAVFFMFNVIVITIFINGSLNKPSTEDFDWSLSFPHLVYEAENTHDEATWKTYDHVDSDTEDGNGYHASTDDEGYDEDSDDNGSDDDDDDLDSDEEEQDHKDLERRIEEFIAKNYKQRREELIYERLSFSSRVCSMQL